MSPSWSTRLAPGAGEGGAPAAGLSPSLLFAKWHEYDSGDFKTKESRLPFLEKVAGLANDIARGPSYTSWNRRYVEALAEVAARRAGPPGLQRVEATTVWRLVAGLGTNPAFETGLHLHPLLGFPYLPGSSVRGLVRHVAESELLGEEECARWAAAPPEPAERPAVERFLAAAERVWISSAASR